METQELKNEVISPQQETGAQSQVVESMSAVNVDPAQPSTDVDRGPSDPQQQPDALQVAVPVDGPQEASTLQQAPEDGSSTQAFTLSVSVPQPAVAQEGHQSQETQVLRPDTALRDNSAPSVGCELSALGMVQDANCITTAGPASQSDLQAVLEPYIIPRTKGRGQSSRGGAQLKRLTFYTWWFEDAESSDLSLRVTTETVGGGLTRYHCTIQFDIASKSFSVTTAAGGHSLAVGNLYDVKSALGFPLDWWDLHVGASITILGRKVTLLKADGPTAAWVDQHAKRLHKLKEELQAEVQKYKPHALPAAVTFNRGSRQDAGGMAVRNLVVQIHALLETLQGFRPRKAGDYQERLTMLGAL